jgi:transposase
VNGPAQREKELGEQRAVKAERDAARKKRAIAMFEDGFSNKEVASRTQACAKTVAKWRKAWKP